MFEVWKSGHVGLLIRRSIHTRLVRHIHYIAVRLLVAGLTLPLLVELRRRLIHRVLSLQSR